MARRCYPSSANKKLLKIGLKPNSNVLELGSGVGVITFLLSKYIKSGKIEAVDISPKSIDFGKSKIKTSNVTFFASDIVTHKPSLKNIDFIVLFDILEHIPIEQHNQLFRNLATIANTETKILVNIPSPESVEYSRIHTPETLQIIDQPIYLSHMVKMMDSNNLTLLGFESYNIWTKNDYHFYIIEQKKEYTDKNLSSNRNFLQKVYKKLERKYVRLKYKY